MTNMAPTDDSAATVPTSVPRLDATQLKLPGWSAHLVRAASAEAGNWRHFSLWLAAGMQSNSEASLAGVEIYETASAVNAKALALRLANSCEIGEFNVDETLGDRAYVGEKGLPVIFASGPFATVVCQGEHGSIPALDIARAVAGYLRGVEASPP